MRLWTRIRQAFLKAFSTMSSKVNWQRLGRKRYTPPDAEVGLIHDILAKGTPMSLASLKAALDATASVQDKRPDVDSVKSLSLPAIGGSCTIFV